MAIASGISAHRIAMTSLCIRAGTARSISPSLGRDELKTLSDLDSIEARANAAAPGPWKLRVHLEDDMSWLIGPRDCDAEFYDTDAYFIANARTDVPALVAEVRRLRARLELVYAYDSNLIDALEADALKALIDHAYDAVPKERAVCPSCKQSIFTREGMTYCGCTPRWRLA